MGIYEIQVIFISDIYKSGIILQLIMPIYYISTFDFNEIALRYVQDNQIMSESKNGEN